MMKTEIYSLCIPTMRRWSFLERSLPIYLANPYLGEIVIVDETGEDYEILKRVYGEEARVRLYKNEQRLGPFLNKLKCMQLARHDWICLVDSDNFVDIEYFHKIEAQKPLDPRTIYMPSFAEPHFDYRQFNGEVLTKTRLSEIYKTDRYARMEMCLNHGNYVISKTAVETLSQYEGEEFAAVCSTCDVLYANYLLVKNNFILYIVPDLTYSHVVHENSVFLQESSKNRNMNTYMYSMFRDFLD